MDTYHQCLSIVPPVVQLIEACVHDLATQWIQVFQTSLNWQRDHCILRTMTSSLRNCHHGTLCTPSLSPWHPMHTITVTMAPSAHHHCHHGTLCTPSLSPWHPMHTITVTMAPSAHHHCHHGTLCTPSLSPWHPLHTITVTMAPSAHHLPRHKCPTDMSGYLSP